MVEKQIGIAHMSDNNKIYNETLRPGCIYSLDGQTLRAVKADLSQSNPCIGCALNSYFTCPNIIPKKGNRKRIACMDNGLIFKNVNYGKV